MQLKKIRIKSKVLLVISYLFFAFGTMLIVYDYTLRKQNNRIKEENIQAFYEEIYIDDLYDEYDAEAEKLPEIEQKSPKIVSNYIGVLKIPKINLEAGFVDRYSYLNNIKYNIEILKDSAMPDEENGNVIIAAHSGTSQVSYFKNLFLLRIGDEILIDYKGKKYQYKVVNIYDIKKTGKAKIVYNKDTSILTLITCRYKTDKQIIVISELMN